MVDGLDVKYSVMLVPVTMFFYITAMLNPIIKLICDVDNFDNCREKMRSKWDDDFGDYADYLDWRGGNRSLQSDGNVTLLGFTHGYVVCDSCEDCEDNETCADYDDNEFQKLLRKLGSLDSDNDTKDDYNWSLPSWLNPNCSCKDWCANCDGQDLVSLPGNGTRTMNNLWYELLTQCEEWEMELGTTDGEMCKLFRSFSITMALTVGGILMLGIVWVLMMFMEYTNFHIFYGGKCKFCFISLRVKKVLFTVLLTVPVTFMLIVGVTVVYGPTEELLNNYFRLIGAKFIYIRNTNGVIMFWISMGLGILSILVMMMSGKTTRHLRTIIHYRRGVVYSDGNWKPHSS